MPHHALRNVSQCFQKLLLEELQQKHRERIWKFEFDFITGRQASFRLRYCLIHSSLILMSPFTLEVWWLFGRQYSNSKVASWEGYTNLDNTKHFHALLKHILVIVRSLDLRLCSHFWFPFLIKHKTLVMLKRVCTKVSYTSSHFPQRCTNRASPNWFPENSDYLIPLLVGMEETRHEVSSLGLCWRSGVIIASCMATNGVVRNI